MKVPHSLLQTVSEWSSMLISYYIMNQEAFISSPKRHTIFVEVCVLQTTCHNNLQTKLCTNRSAQLCVVRTVRLLPFYFNYFFLQKATFLVMFWGILKWGDISSLSEREKKLNLTKKCPWFFLQLEQVDEAASVTVICLDCRLCVSAVFCGRKRLMTFVCCTCRIYPHSHVEDHRSVSHILHQCFVTVEVRVHIFPAVNKDVTLVTSGCLWQLMRKCYGHLDKGEWLDFPFL